eukprot:TRINITY_DN14238_c0_g1_i1.p1 TRINITY_DN14238_c0_g1~~TRINITY_DN14238_c0_g1_i1.p1  ORF type:complete len:469 (+),score=63.44 TRINITY_DN14238_c0_g1_i1:44-1408(+)
MPVPVAAQRPAADRKRGPRRFASPTFTGSLGFGSQGLQTLDDQRERPRGLRTQSLQRTASVGDVMSPHLRSPGRDFGSSSRHRAAERVDLLRLGYEWCQPPPPTKRQVAGRSGNMTSYERQSTVTPSGRETRRKWVDPSVKERVKGNRACTSRMTQPGRYVDTVKTLKRDGPHHLEDSTPFNRNEEIIVKPSTHSIITGELRSVGHMAGSSPWRGCSVSPARSVGSVTGKLEGRRRCHQATGALNTSGGWPDDRGRGIRRVANGYCDHPYMIEHPARSGVYGGDEARVRGVARGLCSPTARRVSGAVRDSGDILSHGQVQDRYRWVSARRRSSSAGADRSTFSAGFSHWEAGGEEPVSPAGGLRRLGPDGNHIRGTFQPYVPPDLQQRLLTRRKEQPWLHSHHTQEGMHQAKTAPSMIDAFGVIGSPVRGRARSVSAPRSGGDVKSLADFVCGR